MNSFATFSALPVSCSGIALDQDDELPLLQLMHLQRCNQRGSAASWSSRTCVLSKPLHHQFQADWMRLIPCGALRVQGSKREGAEANELQRGNETCSGV
ncbi:uncharacterized protein WM294_014105 isoform 3-T3 [Sarcoramphus papa]